jgi:hypothetical protein
MTASNGIQVLKSGIEGNKGLRAPAVPADKRD